MGSGGRGPRPDGAVGGSWHRSDSFTPIGRGQSNASGKDGFAACRLRTWRPKPAYCPVHGFHGCHAWIAWQWIRAEWETREIFSRPRACAKSHHGFVALTKSGPRR